MRDRPPFSYRLEHRDGASTLVLGQTGTYTSAIEAVETWSTTLRGEGAEGAIVVIEEAFGTVVARYPLDSSGPPFDHGHVDRPPGGR
jgi:hypothetical protein